MLLKKERTEIVKYGKKMILEKLTKGTGGNISVFNIEQNLMAITPSGIDYLQLTPNDIVVIDVETGEIIEGDKVPSSEVDMHRIFYKYRKDIGAIVHTHSKFATALSCLNQKLPAIHYLLAVAGVEILCAKYETYGTVKLAKSAFKAMMGKKATLLSNHGMIAGGESLLEAYNIAENVEFCCELYSIAKTMGEPEILSKKEMECMMERFKNYGKKIEEHEKI